MKRLKAHNVSYIVGEAWRSEVVEKGDAKGFAMLQLFIDIAACTSGNKNYHNSWGADRRKNTS